MEPWHLQGKDGDFFPGSDCFLPVNQACTHTSEGRTDRLQGAVEFYRAQDRGWPARAQDHMRPTAVCFHAVWSELSNIPVCARCWWLLSPWNVKASVGEESVGCTESQASPLLPAAGKASQPCYAGKAQEFWWPFIVLSFGVSSSWLPHFCPLDPITQGFGDVSHWTWHIVKEHRNFFKILWLDLSKEAHLMILEVESVCV